METEVVPFVRVKVPLGITKTYTAMVVRTHDVEPKGVEVKAIISVIDRNPVLLPEQYKIWAWISDYYLSPIGDVMRAALPTGMKALEAYRPKMETYIGLRREFRSSAALHLALNSLFRAPNQLKVFNSFLAISHWDEITDADGTRWQESSDELPRHIVEVTREELVNDSHAPSSAVSALCSRGLLYLYDKEVGRLNNSGEPHPENIKPLNEYQQEALDKIEESFRAGGGKSSTCVLHGVTSSGKTEIYIHLIQKAIDEGRQVLYLLPEIALTVQITQRLQRVFGRRIGIYHSKYSDAERVEIWQKQLSDLPYDIILGARSAVFLPFQRLGLVIVDEEHETSFKQQDPAPRYHGRSVAQVLASLYGANTVLGSATPSLETYYNAMQGKYSYVRLDRRYKDLQLPVIRIVNVKDLRRRKIMRGLLSPDLRDAIAEALNNGEQVILFQNRRGFSPIIECHECGWSPKCPHCDVSLTYHKNMNNLSCHYCGYTYRMPTECPDCGNRELKDRGYGTEKIEDVIQDEFPNARIARMDLDTTRTRNAYERIISDFSSHKTNILIGTQMVTKGLDFDHVSVVGILSADSMLNQPDFRAWEHSFMMMTQVAGRAGRKGHRGLVILQTNHPEYPVVGQIVRSDHEAFFRDLLNERRDFSYPPFTRLMYIYLKHRDSNVVETAGIELASRLRASQGAVFQSGTNVLGPDKPVVARIKTLFIRKIMLKIPVNAPLSAIRQHVRSTVSQLLTDPRYKSLQIHFDADPV